MEINLKTCVPPFHWSHVDKWDHIWYPTAAAVAKLLQSCLTLCDPIDGSPPGSSPPGILQARTLEWVAIGLVNLNSRFTPCPFQAGLDSSAFFLVCGSLVTQLTLRMEEWEMEPVHLKL